MNEGQNANDINAGPSTAGRLLVVPGLLGTTMDDRPPAFLRALSEAQRSEAVA